MFKLIGVLSQAIIDIVTSITGFTKSLDNLIESANSSTNALKLNAIELEEDVKFECQKKSATRKASLKEYEAQLELLVN